MVEAQRNTSTTVATRSLPDAALVTRAANRFIKLIEGSEPQSEMGQSARRGLRASLETLGEISNQRQGRNS